MALTTASLRIGSVGLRPERFSVNSAADKGKPTIQPVWMYPGGFFVECQ
jgi:hypothetical protein